MKKFDYKKRMSQLSNRKMQQIKKTITTSAIASALILNSVPTAFAQRSVEQQSTWAVADAAEVAKSLAEVQLLTDVSISADLSDLGEMYNLSLGMTGTGLADAELLTPDRVAVFYAPELAGKMEARGPASVQVEILPIHLREDLPALYEAVGGLTGTLTGLLGELTGSLDEILNKNPLLKPFVSIQGLTEVNTAIDNLNNLDQALADLTAYTDDVEVIVNPDGSVVINFSDGLGNHLETAISDVVTGLVNDLLAAVGELRIEVLPGVRDIPIVGPVLDGVVNDLILNGIVGNLLSGVTGSLQPAV